jgi:hypothetical protein
VHLRTATAVWVQRKVSPMSASSRSLAFKAAVAEAMSLVCMMVRAGESPAAVAAYVLSLPAVPGVAVSQAIEELAVDGSFAEAVFHILAG